MPRAVLAFDPGRQTTKRVMMPVHGNRLQQHEFCNNPSYEIPTGQTVCVVMNALAKRYFRKSNPGLALAGSFER